MSDPEAKNELKNMKLCRCVPEKQPTRACINVEVSRAAAVPGEQKEKEANGEIYDPAPIESEPAALGKPRDAQEEGGDAHSEPPPAPQKALSSKAAVSE